MCFEAARKTAIITGVPEYRIRQMIKEGKVPGFYAGKKYIINVDAFIEALTMMSKQPEGNDPRTE